MQTSSLASGGTGDHHGVRLIRPTPDYQQGYVVAGRLAAYQLAHHLGAHDFRGLRHDDPAQSFQPVINQLARALDQAIGVEAQQGTGRDRSQWMPVRPAAQGAR